MNNPADKAGTLPAPVIRSRPGTESHMAEAFDACEQLARSHYENFSVGTRLLPKTARRHLYAVYAFCRGVDDLGDEATGDRLALLDDWEEQLRLCYQGTPTHPYFTALHATIREFGIPQELFRKLVEANRRDQRILHHPNFEELLDYCDHSANPVGRIVLHVLGHTDPKMHQLSDHTCTALQLANFWQDVRRDREKGRIYLPADDMRRFGVTEGDIASGHATPAFRSLMKFQVERARDLFMKGYPLADMVRGRFRIDLALFTAGGLSVLQAIERLDYDVLALRPEVGGRRKARLIASAVARTLLRMDPLPRRLFRTAS
jgi:squalene synthase HpnC